MRCTSNFKVKQMIKYYFDCEAQWAIRPTHLVKSQQKVFVPIILLWLIPANIRRWPASEMGYQGLLYNELYAPDDAPDQVSISNIFVADGMSQKVFYYCFAIILHWSTLFLLLKLCCYIDDCPTETMKTLFEDPINENLITKQNRHYSPMLRIDFMIYLPKCSTQKIHISIITIGGQNGFMAKWSALCKESMTFGSSRWLFADWENKVVRLHWNSSRQKLHFEHYSVSISGF